MAQGFFGDGEGFGCGGRSTFRLLRIVSHAGADFTISLSEPRIDKLTNRSETIRKYESMVWSLHLHAGNKQQSRAANQYLYELHQSPPAKLGQHINADSAKARSPQSSLCAIGLPDD
jgi:hypothetical protein